MRAAGWLLLFAIIIIPHLLCTLLGRRDLVPPPFLGGLARISGVRVRIVGKPAQRALLLANHQSWLDILTLAGASRTAFVAQSGLSTHPVLAWLCLQNATLFISRDQRATVAEQVAQVTDRLGKRRLTIFPESTTNDGTGLLPFRSSLLSAVERLPADIPVQPVALDYEDTPAMVWFGDEPGLDNFKRILARTKPILLTIRFLDPLTGDEMTNRKTMAAAAQAKIEAALRF
ncbi:lysophospholipid acyltransferase family protein [Alteraurantiacibacter aestuarii]|uniref:lysophospholipid acyltransferase family protein n=1 Tax=Alteraurantiacibacter aestuarii TaxID=650004 RepID=UPI001F3AE584|nr:lysophospholipid acyltransferase family protein [Alteraurantiacibacter aestuarii]